ncbi:hypothetical protein [[Eubacterium] cellulosolvens]
MFGSTTEDIDGVPKKDIDRGPPEEMRMTEAELRGAMQDVAKAKLSMGEIATVQGLLNEQKILRQMVDDVCAQNNHLVNLYSTLRNELDDFRKQWNIERMSWIARNGGSTTPEDN